MPNYYSGENLIKQNERIRPLMLDPDKDDEVIKEILLHSWLFKGERENGKFYTLDGKEISDLYYIKWSDFDCLSPKEKDYVIADYFKMKEKIAKIGKIFKEQVLWDEPI